jgi:hypothetical protein
MFPRLAVAAFVVLAPGAALSPTVAQPQAQALNCAPPTRVADDSDTLSQQIRDKLTAEGFKDVQIKPTAYLVSARDKNDQQIVLLIGPDSMTVLQGPGASGGDGGNVQGLDDKDAIKQ